MRRHRRLHKNLGMGAVTRETKGAMHDGAMPVFSGECSLCKTCSAVCPGGRSGDACISYSEGHPSFNYGECYGCSKCIQKCPQKCLKPKVAELDGLLADAAAVALKTFRKVYYVNVLRSITNRCDCQKSDVHVVMPDIGILMGRDIVAIDRASLDLVNERAGRSIFDGLWHKDSGTQIREAEALGMGNPGYEIKRMS